MNDEYRNALLERHADPQMSYLFSRDMRYKTWRRLWIALAEAELEMGLGVTREQIEELRSHQNDLSYEEARAYELETHHEVMAQLRAYGDQCPLAKPIIQLGASSSYVVDNTALIIADRALELIEASIAQVLAGLAQFARKHAGTLTLAYTHLQPAQLTTAGKRATLWIQDLILDLGRIRDLRSNYMLRGLKGATGTQAGFLILFDGDYEKVEELERRVLNKVGYLHAFPVTGRSYPGKFNSLIMDALSGVAQSACRFGQDLRFLQGLQEYEEPFALTQVGSSALPHKRNPVLSEEMCSLARLVMSLAPYAAQAASNQSLEGAADDGLVCGLAIPEAFLAVQSILNLYLQITNDLAVDTRSIAAAIQDELPFVATEAILMEGAKRGGDRQQLHEKLRQYSMQARYRMHTLGEPNTLLDVISRDSAFHLTREDLDALTDADLLAGAAKLQVEHFVEREVQPVISRYAAKLDIMTEIAI